MPSDFAFDVFLSHNSEDKPRVLRLAERLKAAGLRVWLDEWSIVPGDDIYLSIERGLEAARTLVLFLSPAALESDWVSLERSTVIFRDPGNAERRFLPVLLKDCNLPDTLRRYRYIDLRKDNKEAFAQLLASCKGETPPSVPPPWLDKRIKLFVLFSLSVAGLLLFWVLVGLQLLPGLRHSTSLLIRPSPLGLGALGDGVASLRVLVRTKEGVCEFTSKPCLGPPCPRSSYLLGKKRPLPSRLREDWKLELAALNYPEGSLKYKTILIEWLNFQALSPELDLVPGMEIRIELKNLKEILACKELNATEDFIDVSLPEGSKCDSPSTRWGS